VTATWTVKQLREALADLPDETEVRVATEPGGGRRYATGSRRSPTYRRPTGGS
jgi:hypothetical protein